jgi:hypothetical protein
MPQRPPNSTMVEVLRDVIHEFYSDKDYYMQYFYLGIVITSGTALLVITTQ